MTRRTFSVVPPRELMEPMKSPRDGSGGGSPAREVGGATVDGEQLARTGAEFTARSEHDASGFGGGCQAAVDPAQARCADDADAAKPGTREAWVTAMRVGSALFATLLAGEGTVCRRVGGFRPALDNMEGRHSPHRATSLRGKRFR
ncbi:hypothetical protein [Embleya scabrispora]|uniref:hypothetical protein n=1 Tax=Embleya scabrispora TaxID=159449 RepID=UPI00036BECA9|nr:hypothetical protein [Embleya scabrispora]MYS86223.1 hypothetical protein [Streptomyces sp. SID5474]